MSRASGPWPSAPTSAVVYSTADLLFDTQLVTLHPLAANVRDPIGRLGVTHVLVGALPADPAGRGADPARFAEWRDPGPGPPGAQRRT